MIIPCCLWIWSNSGDGECNATSERQVSNISQSPMKSLSCICNSTEACTDQKGECRMDVGEA